MNCIEFERDLPDCTEGGQTAEQRAHLNSCSACAGLLADLNFISSQARLLQDSEEPSPAVWNALERQLRREGLIVEGRIFEGQTYGNEMRRAASGASSLMDFFRRQRAAWLVPVAAALLIAAGLKLYRPFGAGDTSPVARVPATASAAPVSGNLASGNLVSVSDDQQVLNTMASRFPSQQATYRRNLDEANAYIRDAEQSIRNDPNDPYSQQLLINAYEQKQMLYDLAVNRAGEQ